MGGVFSWLSYKEHFTEGELRPTSFVFNVCKNLLSHYSFILNMIRKMMKTLFALCFMAFMAFVTVEAAVGVARSPQEEDKPWWCDPNKPGYAFILNEGVKTWCEENA